MFVTGTINHMVDRKLYRPRVTIEGERVGLPRLTTAGGERLYFDSLQRTELQMHVASISYCDGSCNVVFIFIATLLHVPRELPPHSMSFSIGQIFL